MASTLRQDLDLDGLFKKLGHTLEEIRVRTLGNIISKLEHQLICAEDLIHERHLLIRLLEWFNFPVCPMKQQVLELLLQLSQHTPACEILHTIGGMDFLSQLRINCDPPLHGLVDQIMESMLKLPSPATDRTKLTDLETCVYLQHNQQIQNKDSQDQGDWNNSCLDDNAGPHSSYASSVYNSTADSHASMGHSRETSHSHISSQSSCRAFVDQYSRTVRQHMHMGVAAAGMAGVEPVGATSHSQHYSSTGYFTELAASQLEAGLQQTSHEQSNDVSSSFRMTTLPWLFLTTTDCHVLSSTHSSLQSSDAAMLVSACDFLSNVVFHDFPAEIFIQRPNIVRSLLSILSLPTPRTSLVIGQALQTLTDLTSNLKSRTRFYQDPALYTPKQDVGSSTVSSFSSLSSATQNSSNQSVRSSDARPAAIGRSDTRHRGDGQDGDTPSFSSRSGSLGGANHGDLDLEDAQTLQFLQMTLPQFCVDVLRSVVPLLDSKQDQITTKTLVLLSDVCSLMADCMTIAIWADTSQAARELKERLTECFECLGELVYKNNSCHGNKQSKSQLQEHDLIYQRHRFVSICVFVSQLLGMLVPPEMAKQILPDGLVAALGLVIFDEPLGYSYPEVQQSLVGYVENADPVRHVLFEETCRLCVSMEKSCNFLMMFDEQHATKPEKFVSLAKDSIASLPYHHHMVLVTKFIALASYIGQSSNKSCKYRGVLLWLLSHPCHEIRQYTYKCCLEAIKECLSVSRAAGVPSKDYLRARFLLDSHVIMEIAGFGMADTDSQVREFSESLLNHLLRSEMLMGEELWSTLIAAFTPVLPVLQAYADLLSTIGRTTMAMLEPDRPLSSATLPLMERFRGILRLMLSPDIKIRAEMLKHLAWFLANEKDAADKKPVFSELDVSNLTNLFIVELPRSVDEEPPGCSVFKIDSLKKVYEIFTSSMVDPSVRKSALDQLAIILKDPALHAEFGKDGGCEKIFDLLLRGVFKSQPESTTTHEESAQLYLPSCVVILRCLAHHDTAVRHRLATEPQMYYTLVRCALLYNKDSAVLYEVSHLLTLLLFDEVASFSHSSSAGGVPRKRYTLPAVVKPRYRLPFRVAVHAEVSPHQVPLLANHNLLKSSTPGQMLRVTWHIAWHDGMENLVEHMTGNDIYKIASEKEFGTEMQLSLSDRVSLLTTHTRSGIQRCLHDISNATSHEAAITALDSLSAYIVESQHHQGPDVFHKLDWTSVLHRFLLVTPSSAADEALLQNLLHFMWLLLKSTNPMPGHILTWLNEVLHSAKGPLIALLSSAHEAVNDTGDYLQAHMTPSKRSLDKELLGFIANLHRKMEYSLITGEKSGFPRAILLQKLLLSLTLADAPHFYNLASLESTLHCLMHITARPGWSQETADLESSTLCSQLLSSLLEVVSAFHIGRGGTSLSFMGKGVTKAATMCLRHLAFEMAMYLQDNKEWVHSWLYFPQRSDSAAEPGLNWMLTLWAYRDPEVRAAGLGIAVALSSNEFGRILLMANCKHIPGGIWGAAFSILLDHSECSLVRQQAGWLLVNLTAQTMSSGGVQQEQNIWHGPVVSDPEFEVSLVGLSALLALLHHSQFYTKMATLLINFYPHATIHPVCVAEGSHQMSTSTSASDVTMVTWADTSNPLSRSGVSIGTPLQAPGPAAIDNVQMVTSTPADISSNQNLAGVSASQTSTPRLPASRHHPHPSANANALSTPGDQVLPDHIAGTPTGSGSVASDDMPSVSTPGLITAVCQLLKNLVILAPQDTLQSLHKDGLIKAFLSIIDVDTLHTYVASLRESHDAPHCSLVLCEMLKMSSAITDLAQACVLENDKKWSELLTDQAQLNKLTSIFGVDVDHDRDLKYHLHNLHQSVWSLYTVLIRSGPPADIVKICLELQQQWPSATGAIVKVLQGGTKIVKDVQMTCENFLCVVLAASNKHEDALAQAGFNITQLLDEASCSSPDDTNQRAAGAVICDLLVTSYECVSLKLGRDPSVSSEKVVLLNSLKCLLAVSHSAKEAALNAGLLESCLDTIKQAHLRLNMECINIGGKASTGSSKRKEEAPIQEISMTMDLLRNFMHQNQQVKISANISGLADIVHKLWSWCQQDPPLMTATLMMLNTFVSNCPTACSSMAYTSISSVTPAVPLSGNSLARCMIRATQRENNLDSPHHVQEMFGLVAAMMLSAECRNVMAKSNLLAEFSNLKPHKRKKSKLQLSRDSLWLQLLVNLSFSMDGQAMIFKIQDVVEIVLGFADSSHKPCQYWSLMVLRNLCVHTMNKPRLLANDELVSFLLLHAETGTERCRLLAASSLWALVYNSQKAKAALKTANAGTRLQSVLSTTDTSSHSDAVVEWTNDMHNVINAVKD